MTNKHDMAMQAEQYAQNYMRPAGSSMPMQEWFMLAWARNIPHLKSMVEGEVLNLGAGKRQIGQSTSLDLEHDWDAETMPIPRQGDSIGGIWAHGFFEHLTPDGVVRNLFECQRVLKRFGVLNIVVPHSMSELYVEDITHKSNWHENTLNAIFDNPYYDATLRYTIPWRLRQHAVFIMGVAWRNMGLFFQLVKD